MQIFSGTALLCIAVTESQSSEVEVNKGIVCLDHQIGDAAKQQQKLDDIGNPAAYGIHPLPQFGSDIPEKGHGAENTHNKEYNVVAKIKECLPVAEGIAGQGEHA